MKSISLLKLRSQLGQILDEVRIRGESVVVSRHERPIAQIIPFRGPGKSLVAPEEAFVEWQKKLSPKFQVRRPSKDLLSVIGHGENVPLRKEREHILKYVASKHG